MTDEFLLINSMFLTSGLLYAGISLPLVVEKIKPNKWYGYRTKRTLSNPRIWYAANKVMGFDMLLAGLTIAFFASMVIGFGRSLPLIAAIGLNLAVMFVSIGCAVVHSFLSLRQLS